MTALVPLDFTCKAVAGIFVAAAEPTIKLPWILELPLTWNVLVGEVIPIPTQEPVTLATSVVSL